MGMEVVVVVVVDGEDAIGGGSLDCTVLLGSRSEEPELGPWTCDSGELGTGMDLELGELGEGSWER